MAEVGIHLEDVVVLLRYSPLEACNVGSAQAEFPAAFDEVQPVGELVLLKSFYDVGGTVWRTVVDDEDVKAILQAEDGTDYLLNVLLFVVRRDDYYAVASAHV